MITELMTKIEQNEIPKIVVESWLKDLGLPHSGDLETILQEHYSDAEHSVLNDDAIEYFLEEVNFGGSKNILIFPLPMALRQNLNLESIKNRAILNASNFNVEVFKNELSNNNLKIIYKEEKTFYKVQAGSFDEDSASLEIINDEYYYKPIKVTRQIYSSIEINKTKNLIYIWFDSYGDQGKLYTKRERSIKFQLILNNIMNHQQFRPKDLGNACKSLRTSSLVDYANSNKIYNGASPTSGKNVDIVLGMSKGISNEENLQTTGVTEIDNFLNADAPEWSYDKTRVTWLVSQSNGHLLRNINTTIHKSGLIDFGSSATSTEIEYVLRKVIAANR